ncbi:MAG: hypothetical protein AAFP19_20440 [Bacteroidota bacterium]
MDYKHIETLLEKYWQGATSLEEEKQLREYFNQDSVHHSLKTYQNLFRFFKQEAQLGPSRDFEALLLEETPEIVESPETPVVRLRPYRKWMQIAASVALVLAVYWLWPNDSVTPKKQAINWSKYEIKEEKEALQFVTQTLQLTSRKLNKGTQTAADGISRVKSATDRVIR